MEKYDNRCSRIRYKIERVILGIFLYQETFSSSKKKWEEKKLGEKGYWPGNQKMDNWNLNYPETAFNSVFLNWWWKTFKGVYRQRVKQLTQLSNWHTGNDFRTLEMEICKEKVLWRSQAQRSDIIQDYSNMTPQLEFYFQISLSKISTVHPFAVV